MARSIFVTNERNQDTEIHHGDHVTITIEDPRGSSHQEGILYLDARKAFILFTKYTRLCGSKPEATVTTTQDGRYCYAVPIKERLVSFEGSYMIGRVGDSSGTRAERTFQKLSDDEIGDDLQINHDYSDQDTINTPNRMVTLGNRKNQPVYL